MSRVSDNLQARTWDDSKKNVGALDFSEGAPPDGDADSEAAVSFADKSLVDVEDDVLSDEVRCVDQKGMSEDLIVLPEFSVLPGSIMDVVALGTFQSCSVAPRCVCH